MASPTDRERTPPAQPSHAPDREGGSGEANDAQVHDIVSRGPGGAFAVAGIAAAIVVALYFAFYFFIYLPRGAVQ